MHNLSSYLIFLEVLDNLEKEIAQFLMFEPPRSLIKRLEPSCKLFFEYFEECEEEKFYKVKY